MFVNDPNDPLGYEYCILGMSRTEAVAVLHGLRMVAKDHRELRVHREHAARGAKELETYLNVRKENEHGE